MYTCAGLCHICAVDEPEKLIHMDWLVLLTDIIPIAMRRKECVQVHVCTCAYTYVLLYMYPWYIV